MGRLLSPGGLLFVDVSHRYNARHYGFVPTLSRMLRDALAPNANNGDVVAEWQVDGISCSTQGHVFTDKEMRAMVRAAGLAVEKRFVVDYATGKVQRSPFRGHLLYVLKRA